MLFSNPSHARPSHEWTLLTQAAISGDLKQIRRLISLTDLHHAPLDGDTPLMAAANHGQLMALKMLLPASDAKMANHNGLTALMCAASNGHLACVKALIPHSNVNAKNRHEDTALTFALCNQHVDVIRSLAPLSELSTLTRGVSPLHLAVPHGNVDILNILTDYCPAPPTSRFFDETPLHWAVDQNQFDAAAHLMPFSNVDAQDHQGHTALMKAGLKNNAEMVLLLLPHSDLSQRLAFSDETVQSWAQAHFKPEAQTTLADFLLARREKAALTALMPRPTRPAFKQKI